MLDQVNTHANCVTDATEKVAIRSFNHAALKLIELGSGRILLNSKDRFIGEGPQCSIPSVIPYFLLFQVDYQIVIKIICLDNGL